MDIPDPFETPESWPPPGANASQGRPKGDIDAEWDERVLMQKIAKEGARKYLDKACRDVLTQEALLMDPPILCARSAAGIVVGLLGESPIQWVHGLPVPLRVGGEHAQWIRSRITESLEDLINEDEQAYQNGLDQPDPEELRHRYLIPWFQVEDGAELAAAVRFNRLEQPLRKSFFLIFIEHIPMDDCLDLGLGNPKTIRAQAEQALRTLVDPPPPQPPNDLEGWDPK
ncbi:MAG: hypothetical protein GY930_07310 [bacterium]|nr:hypothetical protein [bacterium]